MKKVVYFPGFLGKYNNIGVKGFHQLVFSESMNLR